MHKSKLHWMVGIATALVLSSCAATENKSSIDGQTYAGWYMQHGGQATFQPCGQSQPIHVLAAADLAARAKKFGLQQDSPVYVRLMGTMQGDVIDVSRVEQFGSPVPVRDCAMTGVVLPGARLNQPLTGQKCTTLCRARATSARGNLRMLIQDV